MILLTLLIVAGLILGILTLVTGGGILLMLGDLIVAVVIVWFLIKLFSKERH